MRFRLLQPFASRLKPYSFPPSPEKDSPPSIKTKPRKLYFLTIFNLPDLFEKFKSVHYADNESELQVFYKIFKSLSIFLVGFMVAC
jgi:hypothetical protein